MTNDPKRRTPEELAALLRQEITLRLHTGFESDAEILEGTVEYMTGLMPPDVARPLARRFLTEELALYQEAVTSWPDVTDCDRLDAAFLDLEKRGIVARSHFTCCGSCGQAEIGDEIRKAQDGGLNVKGYVYYHRQDSEGAVEGDDLMLKYGPIPYDPDRIAIIGKEIQAVVESHGLKTFWDGSANSCIEIQFDWKRRRRS